MSPAPYSWGRNLRIVSFLKFLPLTAAVAAAAGHAAAYRADSQQPTVQPTTPQQQLYLATTAVHLFSVVDPE